MCGFLENNKFLHLGTTAIVTLFLLQTDPAPHQRREKLCGPYWKKFGDPWTRGYCIRYWVTNDEQPSELLSNYWLIMKATEFSWDFTISN